jgi:hypothetical protein
MRLAGGKVQHVVCPIAIFNRIIVQHMIFGHQADRLPHLPYSTDRLLPDVF